MKARVVTAVAVVAALVWSVPTTAQVPAPERSQPVQVCDSPDGSISLFAGHMKNGRIGYGRTPSTLRVPGPTIQMIEGQCFSINLVNDTNERIGFHAHGVDYTVASDGTPHNQSCVAPGRSRTYVIKTHAASVRSDGSIDPGSAGYWHYHDHCRGTTHGTDGVSRGAFGALIVRRADDPVPDRNPFVVVMSDPMRINLRKSPNTPMFQANQGERVEFVVIGHGEAFHTFHLHAHRWADTRTGSVRDLADTQHVELRDNRTVGPADSFGFQVIAGEGVGPGAWMYHCHVQSHSDLGMEGLFVVRTPGGEMTEQTRKAVERWRRGHHH